MALLPWAVPGQAIAHDPIRNASEVPSTSREAGPSDDFALIAHLYRSNEALFAEQRACSERIARARAYLAEPGANPVLGNANLSYLKTKYSGILLLLRANRLQAQSLLSRLDAEARVASPPVADSLSEVENPS